MRFRKSFKVAPGVKVNLGKKSAGVTFGGKLFRQSFNTSGRKTSSASIPGTGISFMNTKTKKQKKSTASKAKRKPNVEFEEVKPSQRVAAPVSEGVQTVDDFGNGADSKARKMKIWPWVVMAVVLLSVLAALFIKDNPEVMEEGGADATSQIAQTTTQFSYAPEDVILKDNNGVLTAFVGDKMVPFNGLVNTGEDTYVVKDGVADIGFNGVYNDNGAYKLVNGGKVDKTTTGVVKGGDGNWYYTEAGVVAAAYTGVKKNDYGRWYIKDGKVDFGYSGDVMSDGSTYVIKDGKVDTSQNGVMKVDGKWAYVADGMVSTNYTGVKSNEYGTWFIKKGYVDFGYTGTVDAPDGNKYTVSNGKASKVTTTRAATQSARATNEGSYSSDDSEYYEYVGNSSSYKFHYASCRDVGKMNAANKVTGHPRSWYINNNYEPCGHCHP